MLSKEDKILEELRRIRELLEPKPAPPPPPPPKGCGMSSWTLFQNTK